MFLADLHVHSQFSDGQLSISELVDFYGTRGFGCIAVTDHLCETSTVMGLAARYMSITLTEKTFPLYLATIREEGARAWDQYKMIVIPGFELTQNSFSNHRSAHILGVGVTEYMSASGDAVALARAIRSQGGLAIAAHPVPTGKIEVQTLHLWRRRRELCEEFDAWEVASGKNLFDPVAQSGLPLIATSDFHSPKNIAAWKTLFHCERHKDAILDSIRFQNNLEFKFFDAPRMTSWAPPTPTYT